MAYMVAIFYVSSLRDAPLPSGLSDKPAHAMAYLGLGLVIARAVSGGRVVRVTFRHVAIGLAIASAYAASDELHQSFVPGRTADVADWFADTLGSGAALVACWAWAIIATRSGQFSGRRRQ